VPDNPTCNSEMRPNELDAVEGELLVKTCHILLVTGEAIESFGYHDIEQATASVLQELLIARSEVRCSAHRAITVGVR